MRVLLIGCGAIGTFLARELSKDAAVELVLHDRDAPRAETLARTLPASRVALTIERVPEGLDLAVEAASQAAVAEHGVRVLDAGVDLLVLSVGALVDRALRERMLRAAEASGTHVLVPSGAVGAIDALKAARLAGLTEVVLTTRKPPAALGEGPLTEPAVLFDGPAAEAVRRYPKNVNVAAVVALAGAGFDATRVRVVADPSVTRNTHEILARGAFGSFTFRTENEVFQENPATSRLAAFAALETIRARAARLRVGT